MIPALFGLAILCYAGWLLQDRRGHPLRYAILGIALLIFAAMLKQADAADEETCRDYSANVERLVQQLTSDVDVAQAARDSGYKWCIWTATEPPSIRIETATDLAGTAPAAGRPASARDTWCRSNYRSYRASDATVLRKGSRVRVPCPFPGT